jgi:hypothetical protein
MSTTDASQTITLPAAEQAKIVHAAMDALLNNFAEVETHKDHVAKAKGAADKAADSQLGILRNALEKFPEPITEAMWESAFSESVASRLTNWTVNGVAKDRYKNKNTRDVMVNTIKVAAMGLTLSKHQPEFAPSEKASGNLKKYADEVRPKLQEEKDPATGEPRLRSYAKKPPKKLTGDTYYWLVGCEDAEKRIAGPNTVIGGDYDLQNLQRTADKMTGRFALFVYLTSKVETLPVERAKEPEITLGIANTAVISQTFSEAN